MEGVVAAAVYAEGKRVCDIEVQDACNWATRPGHFVWIGLHEPDHALLRVIQQQFGLHDLAIEDAFNAHQRPKVERYDETLFLVLRTAQLLNGRVEFGETHIFIGRGFVVSVRHGPSTSYKEVRNRAERSPHLLKHGVDFVLHSILDFIVDSYFPVLDTLETEMSDLEEALLQRPPGKTDVERIHQLRGDLANLRRATAPLQDVCLRLQRSDLPMIDDEIRPYYRDVLDHVIRINEGIDSLREALSFAFEAGMMVAAARQTSITRKLAAWAAMLAVPTAVAGIYGMNFQHMPELEWEYGYYVVLGVIFVVMGILYFRFRAARWL